MTAPRGKSLLIAGCVAALIVTAAIFFVASFDSNHYKPKFETAASVATGLDVRIHGKMGLSFFPFGITAEDIHVGGSGSEILSLDTLNIRMKLLSLLKKQYEVIGCELVKPVVTVVKDAAGRYNFESKEKKATGNWLQTVAGLRELRLSKGSLVYLDRKTGEKTELLDVTLAVKDLSFGDAAGDVLKSVSFSGNMECRELRKKTLLIRNVRSSLQAEKGVCHLKPFTMDIFGAKGEGAATVDWSGAAAVYAFNVKVPQLDFEKLEEAIGARRVIGGKGDLLASLTIKKQGGRTLLGSMDGTFSLRGDNLVIYTMDLDKVLSKFETSQEFNLVDLGAFFVAGPLGTLATGWYRYGDLYQQTRGGQGAITQFISQWEIRSGVADATDCGLATPHNRVALKGRLNLVSERYENVIVALLDDQGCAKFTQSISGSFGKPAFSGVTTVDSLAGPIIKLYRKAKRLVQGGTCEVFYSGSVQPSR